MDVVMGKARQISNRAIMSAYQRAVKRCHYQSYIPWSFFRDELRKRHISEQVWMLEKEIWEDLTQHGIARIRNKIVFYFKTGAEGMTGLKGWTRYGFVKIIIIKRPYRRRKKRI